MTLSKAMSITASGMTAERYRLDITAGNLANQNTTASTPGGSVFARQLVEISGDDNGVHIVRSYDAPDGRKSEVIPGHPGADANGNVLMTNVNPVEEMVDMMSATRAYEANVKAFNAAKGMAKSALDIGAA